MPDLNDQKPLPLNWDDSIKWHLFTYFNKCRNWLAARFQVERLLYFTFRRAILFRMCWVCDVAFMSFLQQTKAALIWRIISYFNRNASHCGLKNNKTNKQIKYCLNEINAQQTMQWFAMKNGEHFIEYWSKWSFIVVRGLIHWMAIHCWYDDK